MLSCAAGVISVLFLCLFKVQNSQVAMFMLLVFGLLLQDILANSQAENLTEFKSVPKAPLYSYEAINLPDEHIPYFLHNNQHLAGTCKQDSRCPYKVGWFHLFVVLGWVVLGVTAVHELVSAS